MNGADEVDPVLNLIKGGGGALLREKIVAQASCREIIVVDDSKLTPQLGSRVPLPVEVLPFAWRSQRLYLESLGAHITARQSGDGTHFYTDQGNLILDCQFGPIEEAAPRWKSLPNRESNESKDCAYLLFSPSPFTCPLLDTVIQ